MIASPTPDPYDHQVAESLVDDPSAGEMRELASGVDALYLSGRGHLLAPAVAEIDTIRQLAGDANMPLPYVLDDGPVLMVAPHGWGKYRYCLDHPTARIGLSTSRHLPAARVQFRSEHLHAVGPHRALTDLPALVDPLAADVTYSVARLDLYADWQGWDLTAADRDRFVTRADTSRSYQYRGRLSGFDFGTRKSHTLTARIYDKTLQVDQGGHDWWPTVWGSRYQPGRPVWRVEFEYARQLLDEFTLTRPTAALAATGDLWGYATEQWLSHRTPTGDTTRSRWPTSPQWQRIEQSSLRHSPVGATRIRRARTAGSIRRLLPAITGYLAAFAALAGTTDIADTLDAIAEPLHDYQTISQTTFAERIQRRTAHQAGR